MRLLADRSGLTKDLSKATARRSFLSIHDRGQVLVDVALMLADGGEAIGDINVLRHQNQILGPVASPPTVWCGNTQEMLAVAMRAGNAGSNTVADNIDALTRAIAQVPARTASSC